MVHKAKNAFLARSERPETGTRSKSKSPNASQSHVNNPGSRSGSASASRVSTWKEKNVCKLCCHKDTCAEGGEGGGANPKRMFALDGCPATASPRYVCVCEPLSQ